MVDSETVASTGALIEGQIEEAEKGGRFKGRPKLVVRLTRVHTNRGIIAITSDAMSRQGGNGLLKRGSPAALRAGARLSFHTISPAIITTASNAGHN